MPNAFSFRCALLMAIVLAAEIVMAAETDAYREKIQPYMTLYCQECHAGEKAKGELDLHKFTKTADVIENFRRWKHVIEFIQAGEMPPEESRQPSITESQQVVAAIEAILISEAKKHADDPGIVLPRRFTNTEYNHAIRDLTGVEIRPTKDFPVDPSGGEGFDNTGEALRMSPNLAKKYLGAAQRVADHLVLKPDGIVFAPFPVTSYNERKKLTEQAVMDFYSDHAVDIADYLEAAWRYRHRAETLSAVSIEDWAAQRQLSGKYLAIVWKYLNTLDAASPLNREIHVAWEALPKLTTATERPAELLALQDAIQNFRRILLPPPPQLIHASAGNWPISHLDFRAKIAQRRDQFDPAAFQSSAILRPVRFPGLDRKSPAPRSLFLRFEHGFSSDDASVLVKRPLLSQADHLPRNDDERKNHKLETLRSLLERTAKPLGESLKFGRDADGKEIDADSFVVKVSTTIEVPLSVDVQRELQGRHLLIPCELDAAHSPNGSVFAQWAWDAVPTSRLNTDLRHLIRPDTPIAAQLAASAGPFCQTFPDEFAHVDESRGLAAGFHLVEGFFRDDRPLIEKVLNEQEQAQLDKLWQELDFVTESAETLLRGFVWFERSEREVLHDERFDFLRSEDPQLVEESLLGRFERVYLDKLGIRRVGDTLEAESPDEKYAMVHGFFNSIRTGLARHQALLRDAEARGLADLSRFAARAYRRPVTVEEEQAFHKLYRELRSEGQSVEGALRGVLTAILMSPHFCYSVPSVADGAGTYPLSDHDLALRLSLFLWSSLPDDELQTVAAARGLQDEKTLLTQTTRMLHDSRINRFAGEFFGQWLRYRDYLEKDSIQADAYPGYTEELKAAIFEEPMRLATFLIQNDRPVTELLSSDVTFVNRVLADHYGGDIQRQFLAQEADHNHLLDDGWRRVQNLKSAGRGGWMGMAITLTKNSAGERTSPVKRGFWTVHHLLGQHFPPPPANVPELPKSEKEAAHTIRELLKSHVADAKCAMCHKHFDSLGLAMEGFDAIGRARTQDSAGRQIDNRAELPNGMSAQGIPELVQYLEQHRKQEFVRTLCRKFLGYALGRSVKLSDEPLVLEMEHALESHEYRFSALFETVVRSPQFRRHRGRDFVVGTQP